MSSIPDDLIEQIRDAADIVELIGTDIDLRRTGSDYRGPCPFHGGSHRNFAVIPKKQMFYCFVCHEGGDVFTYYMKQRGLDYPGAVREVAARVGITIPERSTGGPDPREPLYAAVAVAGDWYARCLREAPEARAAREYLEHRGIDLDRLAPLGLGFAPKGDAFLRAMDALGITAETLEEAGLAVRREDQSLRPRFWGRLLFPIHDLRGRVVGFGGRILGDGEPKYLNSPDSPVFHKGRLLYNLDSAKYPIRRAQRAVVVEGYFDVLRAVEAGVENVVAPLGTAFTSDQAALLKRFTPEVVLLYDSDQAGMRASFRAADEMLRLALRVLVATPPPGEDPDTLVVRGGADALRAVLDDALDVFERKLQLIERKGLLGSLAGRRRALDRLLPTLRATADPVTRDLYIDRASEALGVTPSSIRHEVESGRRRSGTGLGVLPAGIEIQPEAVPSGADRSERHLLLVMIHEPDWRSRIAEQVDSASWPPTERVLFELLREYPGTEPVAALSSLVDGAPRALLGELLANPWECQHVDALVEGALNRIESRPLRLEIEEKKKEMLLAPDDEKAERMSQISTLKRKIDQLTPGARWPVIQSE